MSVLKIGLSDGISTFTIEPYLYQYVTYSDSVEDIMTIGASGSSFIGYLRYFKMYLGTSSIWTGEY